MTRLRRFGNACLDVVTIVVVGVLMTCVLAAHAIFGEDA